MNGRHTKIFIQEHTPAILGILVCGFVSAIFFFWFGYASTQNADASYQSCVFVLEEQGLSRIPAKEYCKALNNIVFPK